jgi:hypothetical protein
MRPNDAPSKPSGDTKKRPITAHEVSITEMLLKGPTSGCKSATLAIDGRFSVEALTLGEMLVVVVRDRRDKNIVLAGAEIKDHQALGDAADTTRILRYWRRSRSAGQEGAQGPPESNFQAEEALPAEEAVAQRRSDAGSSVVLR